MAWATNSLPVPDSPVIKTDASEGATRSTSRSLFHHSDTETISGNVDCRASCSRGVHGTLSTFQQPVRASSSVMLYGFVGYSHPNFMASTAVSTWRPVSIITRVDSTLMDARNAPCHRCADNDITGKTSTLLSSSLQEQPHHQGRLCGGNRSSSFAAPAADSFRPLIRIRACCCSLKPAPLRLDYLGSDGESNAEPYQRLRQKCHHARLRYRNTRPKTGPRPFLGRKNG